MTETNVFDGLFDALGEVRQSSARPSAFHLLSDSCRSICERPPFARDDGEKQCRWPAGAVDPVSAHGAIDSVDLFSLDELLIFASIGPTAQHTGVRSMSAPISVSIRS